MIRLWVGWTCNGTRINDVRGKCGIWVGFSKWLQYRCVFENKILEATCRFAFCDHRTSEEIREKLRIYNWNEIPVYCRFKWTHRLLRMSDTHILRLLYQYTQTDRRNVDRPRRTCTESHPWRQINPGVKSILSLQLINFSILISCAPLLRSCIYSSFTWLEQLLFSGM